MSLSDDGSVLAVGAHRNNGNGTDSGHVRVYSWNVSLGTYTQRGFDIDGEAAKTGLEYRYHYLMMAVCFPLRQILMTAMVIILGMFMCTPGMYLMANTRNKDSTSMARLVMTILDLCHCLMMVLCWPLENAKMMELVILILVMFVCTPGM